MAHLMESNDYQRGTEMAWHNLTEIMTAQEMAAKGFKHELVKNPISVNGNVVPGYFWISGNDDNKLIGEPQFESFGFLTNEQLMNIVRETLKGTGASIASLGTFSNRAKRYVSIKVGSEWDQFKVGHREFKNYLNIQDALDGSMPLIAKASNTCVVCANTFAASLSESSDFKLSVRHTKNHDLPEKINNFQQAIDAYHGASALFKKLFESAESVNVKPIQAKRIFAGFFGEGKEMATRTQNTVERLTHLFSNGRGNNGATGADLLSAVTDFYTHESSGTRGITAQFTSSEVGAAQKSKVKFFESVSVYETNEEDKRVNWAMDRHSLEALEQVGETSLMLS